MPPYMGRTILWFWIFLLPLMGWSQDFDHYQPLKSTGIIPVNLLKTASEKFAIESEEIGQGKSRKEQKINDKFLLESNFSLDAFMLSGKVLLNDPVGEYLNVIKDYLLRDLPEVRDSIKVYAVRSPMVNAFCTNNGIVLVHMGLLAKVKNEAQIAAILCHEFQHYIKQHPLNRFVEGERLKGQSGMRFGNYESYVLAKNRFSREQELEADAKGLDLYLKSAYAPWEQHEVFDVMRYSYLPFDNVPWSNQIFSHGPMQFPQDYRLDTLQEISAEEEYDDDLLSHPNIATRRGAITDRLNAENIDSETGGGLLYVFGEEQFRNIRKMCRFEMARLYLEDKSYESAIYQAYLLSRDHPDSPYLKKITCQSLYGLAKFKNARQFYSVHTDYEDVEGESQQLYYFMEWLEKEELNLLALDYAWHLRQEQPDDVEIANISDDLMVEFHRKHEEFLPDIADGRLEADSTERFLLKSFAALKLEEGFKEAWESAEVTWKAELAAVGEEEDYWERRKRLKKKQKDGEALGLDRVVFVTPIYKKYDQRRKGGAAYLDSESKSEQYNGMINEMAEKVGLEAEILELHELEPGQVDQFNDIVLLQAWISDNLWNEEDMHMVSIYQEDVKYLKEKYGTEYFVLNGVLSMIKQRPMQKTLGALLLIGYIIPSPIGIYMLIKPEYGAYYFNLVMNLNTGDPAMEEFRVIRQKDRDFVLKSQIFYSLLQMKNSR